MHFLNIGTVAIWYFFLYIITKVICTFVKRVHVQDFFKLELVLSPETFFNHIKIMMTILKYMFRRFTHPILTIRVCLFFDAKIKLSWTIIGELSVQWLIRSCWITANILGWMQSIVLWLLPINVIYSMFHPFFRIKEYLSDNGCYELSFFCLLLLLKNKILCDSVSHMHQIKSIV